MKRLILLFFTLNAFCSMFSTNLTPAEYRRLYSEAVANENYTQAFNVAQEYLQAHQITDACYLLGQCYYLGIGTEQNLESTKQLFKAVYESPDISVNSPLDLRQEYSYCSREYGGLNLISCKSDSLSLEDFKPYLRAIEICNDPFSLFYMGYAYWSDLLPGGEDDLIIGYLKQSADQNCIAALALLGMIYDHNGNEDMAVSYYSKAVSIPFYKMQESKGNELFTNPNFETNPLTIQLRNSALFNYAKSLFDLRQHEEAAHLVNQITDRSNLKYSTFASATNICASNYAEALDWANNAISIDTNDGASYFYKGLALYKLNRLNESLTSIKKAIELGNNDATEFYEKYLSNK